MTRLFGGIFHGRRMFVTGHTGFKGAWLSLWLHELGARVSGYALDPPTQPNLFDSLRGVDWLANHVRGDIRDFEHLAGVVREADPDVVFHLAAQPLVREGYRDPLGTVSTNVLGTANLLEAVRRRRKPCAVIVVTSDKCYENREWPFGYREVDRVGGYDPYSVSKGAAELLVSAWRRSFFAGGNGVCDVLVASSRAGNCIGGGDWQQHRLLPDCIRALMDGRTVDVRRPASVRPWQHVLEPIGGYLLLAARLLRDGAKQPELADAWNFGPKPEGCWPVERVVSEVIARWGSGEWRQPSSDASPHEAGMLALNCDKAYRVLGWHPVWDVSRAVEETVALYRLLAQRDDALAACQAQMSAYCRDALRLPNAWIQ